MSEGNAKCPICKGRGGVHGPYGWLRCECTRPTAEQKRIQRRMNRLGARNPDRKAVAQAVAQMRLTDTASEEPVEALLDIVEKALTAHGILIRDRKERALVVGTSKGNHMIGIQRCL